MARLIDADRLIEDIKSEIAEDKEIYPDDEFSRFSRVGMRTVIGIIKNQDTVDPVKHGRWKFAKDVYVSCSVCGVTILLFNAENPHYCPHCGAKMDQDTGGDNNGSGEAKKE